MKVVFLMNYIYNNIKYKVDDIVVMCNEHYKILKIFSVVKEFNEKEKIETEKVKTLKTTSQNKKKKVRK